jgi:photolyase PhrII
MVDTFTLADDILAERTRRLNDKPHRPSGDYVLYWMITALRASENHALERALLSAHRLQKPLVVYHGLSARYTHASDRIHHFILEGEVELAAAIEARGATFVHHVERGTSQERPLDLLVERACLVITEEFPTYDVHAWIQRLAARAPCAVLAVDAACVVPMRIVPKAFDRAFAFRDAVRDRWDRGMTLVPALPPPPTFATPLPFSGQSPTAPLHLPALLASLPIDHSVPVAPERPGGERAAADRWTRFLSRGIASYGARRNDALDDDGPSGLSPYLHFGMIWAGRVARDARAHGGGGAEKFLDELLVWRELAWSWSFHTPGHQSLQGVPRWALDELRRRVPSLVSPSLDALDRGETGDTLWDAAQRRLRRDGWLHNNVRMTWGKQIVAWIQDPARALAVAEELNHRYALDGRDPSSYGGILWCFGLFDRPHEPTREMGRVRSRPTAIHARRLPPDRYAPPFVAPAHQRRRVLVVGAGLAGLTCARALVDAGVPLQLLEKSAAPGGRLVHRLRDGLLIEDGAPFLHGSNRGFVRWMKMLEDEGIVVPSSPPQPDACWFIPRGVRSLTERLARGLPILSGVRVERLALEDDKVRLLTDRGQSFEASAVVLTAPVPQCMDLLSSLPGDPAVDSLRSLRYERALVASFVLDAPATRDPAPGPGISLLVEEGRKRRDGRAFTIHASAEQAQRRAHESDEACSAWLREELRSALGVAPGATLPLLHFKRWRYARPVAPLGLGVLALYGGSVLLAGDGLTDGTAGGAWSSGYAAASLLLASWAPNTSMRWAGGGGEKEG